MSAAIRLEVAREKVSELTDAELDRYADSMELWRLSDRVGVAFPKLELLMLRERLKRGLITPADLPPSVRRQVVDPANVDLHAIAAGPIMDAGEIYLPAGKLSMEETRRRERECVLPPRSKPEGPRHRRLARFTRAGNSAENPSNSTS